ncbi:general secretion pathway protein GspK [Pelagibius sp.]|uniref:general secretion pathway protein GspK n=1 Tax=Pelagibius sp. TaxID=1931238 RepID=UPI003BAD96A1
MSSPPRLLLSFAIRSRRSSGIALVAVLWVVSLLAAIATSFATTQRTEVVGARNQIGNAEARALADAGLHRAVLALASEGEAAARDGRARDWVFDGARVTTAVQAEGGKIDLNGAEVGLLAGLFAAAGARDPEALAAAVADFRDADSDPRPRGAEDADYRSAGLAWEAKDRPFERRDELLQVLGMTRGVYDAVAPVVTVYARSKGIDPATAPAAALAALPGMSAAQAEALAAGRGGGTGVFGLGNLGGALGDNPYLVPSAIPMVTIRAEAEAEGGAVFVREAVVALTPGARKPFHILTWEQGRR